MKYKIFITAIITLAIYSCGPELPDEPNPPSAVPQLSNGSVSYDLKEKQVHLQVFAEDDLALSSLNVSASVKEPNTTVSTKWVLHDDGLNGDQIARDGYFGHTYTYSFLETQQGTFIVNFNATDADSNLAETLSIIQDFSANLPPLILSFDIPDTVYRPIEGVIDSIILKAVASDPNGLEDIISIFAEVQSFDNPDQWFLVGNLNDNGQQGDELIGDGTFSFGISISHNARLVMNVFRFQAKDSAGNFSEFAYDSILVYEDNPPEIHSFTAESETVLRPAGSTIRSLYFTLSISDPNGLSDISTIDFYVMTPDDSSMVIKNDIIAHDDGLGEDAISGDGIYSLNYNFSSEDAIGTYSFQTIVTDRKNISTTSDTVVIHLNNVTPQFTNIDYTATIVKPSNNVTQTYDILITVEDANGVEDIHSLLYKTKFPGDADFGNEHNTTKLSDGEYKVIFTASPEMDTGQYSYKFFVYDQEGLENTQTIQIQVNE